jgi:predicted nucleic acid-binding protein
MSELVVDASVALCWFAREAETKAANRLISSKRRLIAPSLMLAEIANGLWKKIRRGEMTAELAGIAMKEIRRFIPEVVDLGDLTATALELALELDHAVYDCCYLALAVGRGAPFITLDRPFIERIRKTKWARSVTHLADWAADD